MKPWIWLRVASFLQALGTLASYDVYGKLAVSVGPRLSTPARS